MPPDDDDTKKEIKGWRRYKTWIVIGGIILLLTVGVVVVKAEADNVTIEQVSEQVSRVKEALTSLSNLVSNIPTNDYSDELEDILEAVSGLEGINEWDTITSKIDVLDNKMQDIYDLLFSLNQTVQNMCVALNITLNGT
jgi:hypothetical protein